MSKIRKRLTDQEAQFLGLKIKKDKNNSNARYMLSYEQIELLKNFKEPTKKENKHSTKKNNQKPFILSAWRDDGGVMNIKDYCDYHNLPYDDVRSYKLVSHTGIPYYNVLFKENIIAESVFNEDDIKEIIYQRYKKIKYDEKYIKSENPTIVSSFADLHFGADVDNLIRTPDYNSNILANKLFKSTQKINQSNGNLNHVHILGDLIESFTGMNHKNSFKSLNRKEIGAEAIIGCTNMLHSVFLNNINNLGSIKIVAGNHDRVTSSNDEDQDGDAAKLIAFALQLLGYDVEFNPLVVTHLVDDVNHILMHGDKPISKKSTEKIILSYGLQGKYNLLKEGHLHSQIEKLSETQKNNFNTVKDDSTDYKRIVLQSLFTGNKFSETIGFTSASGFNMITAEDGKPEIFNRVL